jgi:deoxyribodipyrimidine photo-lyase
LSGFVATCATSITQRLYHALKNYQQVFCAFVFDADSRCASGRGDRRVEFIHGCVAELDSALRARGGGLIVRHARAREAIPALAQRLGVDAVLANRDYEPAAIARDSDVAERLRLLGIGFADFKDQVIFEKSESADPGRLAVLGVHPLQADLAEDAHRLSSQAYPVDKYASPSGAAPRGRAGAGSGRAGV